MSRPDPDCRLCDGTGIEIPPDALDRRPSIALTELADEDRRRRFLETWDWYLGEIERGTS